jgi:hypothetical protein
VEVAHYNKAAVLGIAVEELHHVDGATTKWARSEAGVPTAMARRGMLGVYYPA